MNIDLVTIRWYVYGTIADGWAPPRHSGTISSSFAVCIVFFGLGMKGCFSRGQQPCNVSERCATGRPSNVHRRAQVRPGVDDATIDRNSYIRRRDVMGMVLISGSLLGSEQAFARDSGDWSSPGLSAPVDPSAPKFRRTASGALVQDLVDGSGDRAEVSGGDDVLVDYVLRRANGYFIYSTVEGVSFQPRDIPTGPVRWNLSKGSLLPGLVEGLSGMRPGGKRRILVPPSAGYAAQASNMEPQMPSFGTKRQLENHKGEPLIFEVILIRIIN